MASSHDGNLPTNTLDRNLATRWSANGTGQSITYTLDGRYEVSKIRIAFYKGDTRVASFKVDLLVNGAYVSAVSQRQSISGLALSTYIINSRQGASAVRITGYGNSINTWNSITEVRIVGRLAGTIAPPPSECGAMLNGVIDQRIKYQSASVAFGSVCVSQTQYRTCTNGVPSASFSPNSFQFDSCKVDAQVIIPPMQGKPYGHVRLSDVGVTLGAGSLSARPTQIYTGPLDIRSSTLIENKIINGCLDVQASNVTLRNVILNCNSHYGVKLSGGYSDFRMEYSDLKCTGSTKNFFLDNYRNVVISHNNVTGCEDFFFIEGSVDGLVVEYNTLHDLTLSPESHADGFQIGEFTRTTGSIHVHGNYIDANTTVPNSLTGIVFATKNSAVNIVLENNYFAEFGAPMVRCANETGCFVRNNIFGDTIKGKKMLVYQAITSGAKEFSCNRHADGSFVEEFVIVDRIDGTSHITTNCPEL